MEAAGPPRGPRLLESCWWILGAKGSAS